jgi:predicted SAM-dependent methyltransferase
MRLNLGCGDRYVPGWHNVDWAGCPHHVDETVDLTGPLPWEPGSVTHIYAGHLFEHISRDACVGLCSRLLELADPQGCLLWAVGPDVELAKRLIETGQFDFTYHSLDSISHGGHRWPGDDHVWDTTAAAVVDLLREAGWPVVTDLGGMAGLAGLAEGPEWPVADRVPQWQYAVRAARVEKETSW